MSSSKNNGKVVVSPVKFNAGGKKSHPKKTNLQKEAIQAKEEQTTTEKKNHDIVLLGSNNSIRNSIKYNNSSIEWIQAGIHKKQSPLSVKNWIATVLTLDGRDKFTKVLQYSSRLLCWYFAGLAAAAATTSSSSISIDGGGSPSQLFYQALSTRFNSLYKSLVTSRKAFRMGRSIIEWDKIKSMGWGDYLAYLLRHPLAEGGGGGGGDDDDEGLEEDDPHRGHHHSLGRYDTHPIPEEDEGEEEDHGGVSDDGSWDGEVKSATVEEKKDDAHRPLSEKKKKVVSIPGRPILPSRISSNIGWGPSTTTPTTTNAIDKDTSSSSSQSHPPLPPPRTVSEMGRQMYRPYPSQSSTSFGSYKQLKDTSTSTLAKKTLSPPTPAWMLIGGTLKLLGLMGFWAFDNISFLTSSGFLDPIRGDTKSNATIRTNRQKVASENAARCYFMGGLAGLYVNLRSFWIHRNGALAEARRKYHDESSATTTSSNDKKDGDDDVARRGALKKTEQKHFELFLALLKSICDVTVFSNNPGIDLHLKLRGKKNHEGLHCLCGLISASTVLYSNFPNAE